LGSGSGFTAACGTEVCVVGLSFAASRFILLSCFVLASAYLWGRDRAGSGDLASETLHLFPPLDLH